jgi:hypothetical protein
MLLPSEKEAPFLSKNIPSLQSKQTSDFSVTSLSFIFQGMPIFLLNNFICYS